MPARDLRQIVQPKRLSVFVWAAIFAGLAPLAAGFGPPVMNDGGYPPVRLSPAEIDALVASSSDPQVTARSALVVDLDSNQVLFSLRPDDPMPPASTAKIMTALLVLSRESPEAHVTVSDRAAAQEGSRMGLAAGEILTVEQLLYGLLIPSGNDAAVALAEHVAGTEGDFVKLMNDTSAALGLAHTHFENSHGLDAPGQVSTAAELAMLAREALKSPLFARIVATRSAVIGGHALVATNELLENYPGADGVKTGTTDNAGECLVASMTRDGHRVIAVVLGSKARYGDVRSLFDYARGWRWQRSSLPDDALAWMVASDGRAFRLRSLPSSDIFVPAWQRPLLYPVRVVTETFPVTATLRVGELRWMLGAETVATIPLSVWPGP